VRGHIPGGGHYDLRVVPQVPDAHVARLAEQAADLASHVIVVDMPAFTTAAGLGGFADGAPVALERDEAVPFFLSQAVQGERAAAFPDLYGPYLFR
jgi:hypothetical protein